MCFVDRVDTWIYQHVFVIQQVLLLCACTPGSVENECCLHNDLHQMHTLPHLIACASLPAPAQSAGILASPSYRYLSLLIALSLLQAKLRRVDPADCQALSDIKRLSAAVLRQHDMLDAFEEVATPKLNTWVVARVTGSTAQPAAMTQTGPNSALTAIHPVPPAAERGGSAVAPEAAATPSAPAEGAEAATRSMESNRSYAMMQAGPGGSSQIPQDADGDKQAGQVRLVRPLALCS